MFCSLNYTSSTNYKFIVLNHKLHCKALSVILLAIVVLLSPFASIEKVITSPHKLTSNSALAAEVMETNSNEFISKVKGSEGIKVIVSFASWCGHCRTLIKGLYNWDVSKLDKEGKHTPMHLYLLALDESIGGVKAFAKNMNEQSIPIYYIENRMQVSRVLYSLGINYQGAVPHVTIFDDSDNIIYNDNADLGTIMRVISKNRK